MLVRKELYFYLKIEYNPEFIYEHGREFWFMQYFKDKMEVLDARGNTIIAEPDTIYLVPPNTRMLYRSVNRKPYTHTALIFHCDEEFMQSLSIPYMTPIRLKSTKELEQLMFDMESKQLSSSKFKLEAQNSYLTLILLLIHDQLHPADKDYNCEPGDDLQTIRLTIMNSPGCAWTVEDMAAKANMRVSGFQRKYKKMYGKSPIADLYDYRFLQSKRLLDTGYSISHILNSCGFKSQQHFSRFFKSRAGVTPSEYRKSINGGKANKA